MAKTLLFRANRMHGVRSALAFVLVAFILAASPLAAGRATELTAVRTGEPPRIDGVLEDAWGSALRISRFEQVEPRLGVPASVKTDVFVLYDAKNLYLAARAYQPAKTIRGSSAKRDSVTTWEGDYMLFAVDSHASGNTAHFIIVNPANALVDGILDSAASWNRDWDGRIVTAASVGEHSWIAEAMIPLDAIGFQAKPLQQWGLLVGRHVATRQETMLSRIGDRNAVYRIDTFPRMGGIRLDEHRRELALAPYVYTSVTSNTGGSDGDDKVTKTGFDARFTPVPSMKVLATYRPDYAQLESDEEIINVSDVPTSYPEKRPFFAESSDFYPGLAVNTRNIGDIEAGLKVRQVLSDVRYDLTAIEDASGAHWFLGDVRWTDNRRYHAELIGGLKDAGTRSDYNVTTNLRVWFLERRLTAYTWFGTINGQGAEPSQWESVNSIRWMTRHLRVGVWNHVKTELYNPNIVGHNTLSNESIVKGWIGWSHFSDRGRLLELSPEITAERFDLYTARGNDYTRLAGRLTSRVRLSSRIGVWTAQVEASPKTRQLFRYRGLVGTEGSIYRDGFGPFALVEQTAGFASIALKTDPSKLLSAEISWLTAPLRSAARRQIDAQASWKIGSRSTLSFSLGRIDVGSSPWQAPYVQTVKRARFEHTFGNSLNVRGVYQSRIIETNEPTSEPALNLLVAWPLSERTSLHFVASETRTRRSVSLGFPEQGVRSIAVKVSHAFSF